MSGMPLDVALAVHQGRLACAGRGLVLDRRLQRGPYLRVLEELERRGGRWDRRQGAIMFRDADKARAAMTAAAEAVAGVPQ